MDNGYGIAIRQQDKYVTWYVLGFVNLRQAFEEVRRRCFC